MRTSDGRRRRRGTVATIGPAGMIEHRPLLEMGPAAQNPSVPDVRRGVTTAPFWRARVDRQSTNVDHLTHAQYHELFGWTIVDQRGVAYLILGNGMVAVSAPHGQARTAAALLRDQGAGGPVLQVGKKNPFWVFLADPNAAVFAADDLPPGVTLLSCPEPVPLPRASQDWSAWVIRPNVKSRWLPSLDAVIAAVRMASLRVVPPVRTERIGTDDLRRT